MRGIVAGRWAAALGIVLAGILLAAPRAGAQTTPQAAVAPASVLGGAVVTVSGSGFAPGQPLAVRCDSHTASTTPPVVVSDAGGGFSADIVAPAGQPGPHTIQVSDGTNSANADFTTTINATISKTTTEAAPGNVGMELTVSGAGFIAGAKITVTTDSENELLLASGGADKSGSIEVTFSIPSIEGGAHIIKVTDGTNVGQFDFVMESKPPAVPALIAPKAGSKASRPVGFEWKSVTDPSGVTYNLQVATSANFTDPLLDKTGLSTATYALASDETLKSVIKETPYYWRVQAVDGAGNESQWTAPASFYLGLVMTLPNGEPALTLSAVLVYLSVGGILVLLGLSFWLGHRVGRRA